ncbi:ribonuclease Z [Entamoeba marina]
MKNSSISLIPLGNGLGELSPTFLLTLDNKKYLFNIPEGTQRVFMEYKMKLPKVDKIFLTSDDWSCCGVQIFSSIPVHSPHSFLQMLKDSNLLPPNSLNLFKKSQWTFEEDTINDGCFNFKPIVLYCSGFKTICYDITMPTFMGKFDTKKADEFGIKGQQRGKLMKGESIVLSNGKTITLQDVCGKSIEPGNILIVHFPTIQHCDLFLKKYQTNHKCVCFCAIISDNVKEYLPFQNLLASINGYVLLTTDRINTTSIKINHTTSHLSYQFYSSLHSILPTFAPTLTHDLLQNNSMNLINSTQKIFDSTPTLHSFSLYPNQSIQSLIHDYHFNIPKISSYKFIEGNKYKVRLLGTAGTLPGKVRNVSGNILQFNNKTILIDCGETTIYHLISYNITIDDIDLVYITHQHFDHILGLISLFKYRTKPITIIGPRHIYERLQCLCNYVKGSMTFIYNDIFSLDYTNSSEQQHYQQIIYNLIGAHIKTYLLHHILELNYGIRFETDDFKIVFTGDTTICDNLTHLCQDVDVVVHESNFSDGNEEFAMKRGHCTPILIEQALKGCNIKVIILNHIGQRTTQLGSLMKKEYSIPMIYGYDGMVFDETVIQYHKEYQQRLSEFYCLNEIEDE